ncbi:hypothetical protein BLOT_013976 [Blomia tropicalis]|nr:hypothetical protein BLOT_013976 [Blomia tropicalis]
MDNLLKLTKNELKDFCVKIRNYHKKLGLTETMAMKCAYITFNKRSAEYRSQTVTVLVDKCGDNKVFTDIHVLYLKSCMSKMNFQKLYNKSNCRANINEPKPKNHLKRTMQSCCLARVDRLSICYENITFGTFQIKFFSLFTIFVITSFVWEVFTIKSALGLLYQKEKNQSLVSGNNS